jgi:hypothetical protein
MQGKPCKADMAKGSAEKWLVSNLKLSAMNRGLAIVAEPPWGLRPNP